MPGTEITWTSGQSAGWAAGGVGPGGVGGPGSGTRPASRYHTATTTSTRIVANTATIPKRLRPRFFPTFRVPRPLTLTRGYRQYSAWAT
ncbi:hypothetical protein RE943_01860 [Prescottella equi]|nr:hypothetical protein RE9414_01920 [Prescottella equi]BCN56816.1 hypothetical protein RE9427_01860 [Prescottella equi]BCN66713.1 hypothetical protein RE943_01860 [Prescottella equi]